MGNEARRVVIARLNDEFRFTGKGGQLYMTAGINALSVIEKLLILTEVRCFNAFTPDNDPHGEHDCAVMTFGERRIICKIDYLPANGFDEADPVYEETVLRVLTIMLGEEY